ncbi:MAG: ClpXP protease specificity-enhancing factor SspB [Pseudomonadota bacterium]
MADDLIRYDVLVQDALRSVVRKVMREVADGGLPGEHHFYIAFDTTAPGVRMSSRLRQQHPEEMTIVLQHQFWDLSVTEHTFEVGLSFGGVPERLLIPFAAIKGFFDPSVQFGLQFDPAGGATQGAKTTTEPTALPAISATDDIPPPSSATAADRPGAATSQDDGEPNSEGEDKAGDAAEPSAGAEVVSLDAFRKKP